jgi:hypothetical protein
MSCAKLHFRVVSLVEASHHAAVPSMMYEYPLVPCPRYSRSVPTRFHISEDHRVMMVGQSTSVKAYFEEHQMFLASPA